MIPGPVVVLILLGALVLLAGAVHYWPAARRATFTDCWALVAGDQPHHVHIVHNERGER